MNRIFSFIGILGGIFWFALHTFFTPNWGPPGTVAYEQYELFNHLWTPGLLLICLGYVGLYRTLRRSLTNGQRGGFMALFIGFAMMMIGNWAEFWLFSEQSYTTGVGRNLAWMTFLIGLLILLIGSLVMGISSFRTNLIPKWISLLLVLLFPLSFIGISQEISLLSNGMFALVAVIIGGFGLWRDSNTLGIDP